MKMVLQFLKFLKGSIATSRDKAYDSSDADDLAKVFKAISESVTTSILW